MVGGELVDLSYVVALSEGLKQQPRFAKQLPNNPSTTTTVYLKLLIPHETPPAPHPPRNAPAA